jgi:hypothetical protein
LPQLVLSRQNNLNPIKSTPLTSTQAALAGTGPCLRRPTPVVLVLNSTHLVLSFPFPRLQIVLTMPDFLAPPHPAGKIPAPKPELLTNEPHIYCRTCKSNFRNFEVFHQHKVNSKKHITCDLCSIDFDSHEGLNLHRKQASQSSLDSTFVIPANIIQVHPKEQNLECPGCHQVFTRLGALISHLDLTECKSLKNHDKPFDLAAAVQEKMTQGESYRAMRNFLEYGRSSGHFRDDEPMPMLKDYSKDKPATTKVTVANDRLVPSIIDSQATAITPDKTVSSAYVAEEGDLLNFDGPSLILNAGWGEPVTMFDITNDFPVLQSYNNPTTIVPNITDASGVDAKSAWGKTGNLFPDAPTAVVTPSSLSSLKPPTIELENALSPYDPENPHFKATMYYIDALGKYRCPHIGCRYLCLPVSCIHSTNCLKRKTHGSTSAFIQHLKSPAHRREKLQCTNCLRFFDGPTALTQHSEAQGVKCKVRETDQYAAEVHKFTGGTAATAGKLEDATVKYVVTDAFKPDAAHIIDTNRAANTAMAEQKNTYWDRHEPVW